VPSALLVPAENNEKGPGKMGLFSCAEVVRSMTYVDENPRLFFNFGGHL
jgi:hypothetical protein